MIRFISLASGSSGNCYYLSTETTAVLIDAGIGIRSIKKRFREQGLVFTKVKGLLVTHDHADHIKSVGVLGEDLRIPVYATQETHVGINKNYCTKKKLSDRSVTYIEKGKPFTVGDMTITPFEVPHDGTDDVGYLIELDGKTFCVATDIGYITETASSYMCKADYLVIESNYDAAMLAAGRYPQRLKERIAGPKGHLCNTEAAAFIAEQAAAGHLKCAWLCHLSQDNNNPELALKTVAAKLEEKGLLIGKDIEVTPLKRQQPSPMYEFE